MENLNAEQVKKAVECCIKAECWGDCQELGCPASTKNGCHFYLRTDDDNENTLYIEMLKDALALINKQETEYNELYELLQTCKADSEAYRSYSKTLEKENEALKTLLNESYDTQNSLTEENERLRAENERYAELEEGCYVTGYKNIKADTVRKMQERLNKRFGYDKSRVHTDYNVHRYIDQIAKEMLAGEK